MTRLNAQTLSQLPDDVARPTYEREQHQPGILHLGVGAFHRAHQAWYTEAVLNRCGGDWRIVGASLRSPTVRDQLLPQDGLYTLVERAGESEKRQVIGAIADVLVGPEDPAALIERAADPAIRIISLTVTEKGYCHDPATGNLNPGHPDIAHDLADLERPKTAVGYLVAALAKRRAANAPVTLLSCDNLPDNGRVLHKVVTQFAEKIDPALAAWIGERVCFPGTMIDRIVPAVTDEDRDRLAQSLGLRDEAGVMTEAFSQWVIEDRFAAGRPAWETVGAQLVDDVGVFEKIKLRMLNGSHSTIAYAGYLAGFETVSDTMAEPAFARMIETFMAREAAETLTAPADFDLWQYAGQLRERFANTALKHRTWQIAMDGSQKLPQRLLHTLREQLRGPGHIDIICLAVAAWMRYVSGEDEQGRPIDVQDPLAERLAQLCSEHRGNPAATVRALVGVREVFGDDLIDEPAFVQTTTDWLERFAADGVLASVRAHF